MSSKYSYLNFPNLIVIIVLYLWRNKRSDECRAEITGGAYAVGKMSPGGVAMFTGIPYAEPPVGNLRFRRPAFRYVKPGERLQAMSHPPACLQNSHYPYPKFFAHQEAKSEDCLYLNIFSRIPWFRKKKPVIFYIHGGSFSNGDGISRDGTGLVDNEKVVFVSLNYRIQLMGFLNHGDDIPKNIGLYDVVAALEWIQEYISYFGGNKNKVTIMGESAGGALVTYLYTSPRTKHLFHQAISLSGSLLAPWAFPVIDMSEQMNKRNIVLEYLGCSKDTSMSAVECLQSQTEEKLLGAMMETQKKYPMDTWAPVIDNEIIPSDPATILNDRALNDRAQQRPLLSGLCQSEATHIAVPLASNRGIDITDDLSGIEDIEEFRRLSVNHPLFQGSTLPCFDDNGDALLKMYVGKERDRRKLKEIYAFMMSDILLFCPQINMATRLSDGGADVYQFVFNYTSPTAGILPEDQSWQGVPHNYDMAYELGYPLNKYPLFNTTTNIDFSRKDRKVSRAMMDIFHSFAAKGKPKMSTKGSTMCLKTINEANTFLHVLNHRIVMKSLERIQRRCNRLSFYINNHGVSC